MVNPRTRNPFLPGDSFRIIVPHMRFAAALGILTGFVCVLAAGIVRTVHGSPWLLIASLGVFVILFVRIGCTEQ